MQCRAASHSSNIDAACLQALADDTTQSFLPPCLPQVPTFIFYRNGEEVGRHVGSSRGDLIGQILAQQASRGGSKGGLLGVRVHVLKNRRGRGAGLAAVCRHAAGAMPQQSYTRAAGPFINLNLPN